MRLEQSFFKFNICIFITFFYYNRSQRGNNRFLLDVKRFILLLHQESLRSLNRTYARYLLVRCSILQRPRDESWFTGESNGEGNEVRGLQKLTGTPLSTPINSIPRYFAASRRAMDIALFLSFSPRAFVIILSSARFF